MTYQSGDIVTQSGNILYRLGTLYPDSRTVWTAEVCQDGVWYKGYASYVDTSWTGIRKVTTPVDAIISTLLEYVEPIEQTKSIALITEAVHQESIAQSSAFETAYVPEIDPMLKIQKAGSMVLLIPIIIISIIIYFIVGRK